MFYKIPMLENGLLDMEYADAVQTFIEDGKNFALVKVKDGIEPKDTWIEINEETFLSAIKNQTPLDFNKILGQFIVQQTLKNAEIQQQLDTVGKSIVQLMLKG